MKTVSETKLLKALGPYSLAVATKDLLYLSGQIGVDSENKLVTGGIETEFKQIIKNTEETLKQYNLTLDNIISIRNYLINLDEFTSLNMLYKQCFREPYPARTTIAVAGIPFNAAIEVEFIASRTESRIVTGQVA